MNNDRIGSSCWYRTVKDTTWKGGTIRHWGMDANEIGPYTCAIVENNKTLMCHRVLVENISFATVRPNIYE